MTLYFAWVDAQDSFDPCFHAREDENIFSFDLLHREAEFPQVMVTLSNPKIGLLSPGRKRRAFISYGKKAQAVLLFDGYVVSMPTALGRESITLELTTETPQSALNLYQKIQDLKQGPYWDDRFVREEKQNYVEEVLDGRTILPHWSRTGDSLAFSDILNGQQMVSFGSHFLKDSLKVSLKHIPLSAMHVEVNAEWIQHYDGLTDISSKINTQFSRGMVETFTGKHLEKSWWTSGKVLPHTSYFIAHSDLVPINPIPERISFESPQRYEAKLVLGWTYRQKRVETLKFILKNNCQPLLSAYEGMPGRTHTLKIRLQNIGLDRSTPLWEPHTFYQSDTLIFYGSILYRCLEDHVSSGSFYEEEGKWVKEPKGRSALADLSAASFFTTERGEQAAVHAVEVARAYLAASSRALEISFETDFDQVCALSCDHMVEIHDSRLPGGKALGKVIAYALKMDGDTGKKSGHVTLACSIGNKQSLEDDSRDLKATPSGILYAPFQNQLPKFGILDPNSLGSDHIVRKIIVSNGPEEQQRQLMTLRKEEPGTALDTGSETKVESESNREMKMKIGSLQPTQVRIHLLDLMACDTLHHTVEMKIPHGYCPPHHVDLSAS
jgi:hypothetical protein